MARNSKHDLSDDEGSSPDPYDLALASAPKRARVESSSAPQPTASTSKSKDAMQVDADESEEEIEDVEDEEEDRRVEEGVETMRKSVKKKGTVAQSAVIEQVDMQNFMCHKLVTISFGPQINFLVGENGSGKSAVLTAITMALGGNAKATNRATKGSGFVRAGTTYAVCAVRLKNKGIDAYQPEVYGDSITIERRINVDSSGGYKIKNHAGKTIETKKMVLDAILDHFNIQVDNPLTVLTQDQARGFLANSTPKDKYVFFLRGTQLAQLTEEYEVIRTNMEHMSVTLDRKKAVVPELKEAYKKAKEKATEAKAAVNQKEKVEELKNELAWAYVEEIETKISRGQELVATELRTGPKIQAEMDIHEAKKKAAEEQIYVTEEGINEQVNEAAVHEAELAECRAAIASHKARLKDFSNIDRSTAAQIEALQTTIANFDQQLAAERIKLNRDVDAERAAIELRMTDMKDELAKLTAQAVRSRHEAEDAEQEENAHRDELRSQKDGLSHIASEIQVQKNRMAATRQTKRSPLLAYGEKIPDLLQAIEKEQWVHKPMGPIGRFVKVKEMKFVAVLEAVFSATLNAFIVQNEKDKQKLGQLMRKLGIQKDAPIIKQQYDKNFDFSHAEPQPEILTMHRALDIQDPFVLQVLVVSQAIEKCALVPRRVDGDALVSRGVPGLAAIFSADMYRLGGSGGSAYSTSMKPWAMSRLNPDNSAQVNAIQAELDSMGAQEQDLLTKKRATDELLTTLHRKKEAATSNARSCASKISRVNHEIEKLDEKLREEEPTNIAAIQEAKADAEAELESTRSQYRELEADRKATSTAAQPLIARKAQLDEAITLANKGQKMLRSIVEKAVSERVNSDSALQQYRKRMETHIEKVADMQKQVDGINPMLQERVEQASTICARPDVLKKRTVKKLLQEIAALERALLERAKRDGQTIEQIMAEVLIRRNAAEHAINAVKELSGLVSVLQSAYESRISRWADFRDAISTRARLNFAYHLSTRGFTGKLMFDHDHTRLNLRVQTDKVGAATQVERHKDAKALSGGETSFSTCCLLLTMWDSVGCPVRCLDEFDVFMDAVNRKMAIKMLIDTGKAADGTQFILISPQSMSGLSAGPEVRVTRMQDPDRGQGNLNLVRS